MNEQYFVDNQNSAYYRSYAHNSFVNDLTAGGFMNLLINHKLDSINNDEGNPPYNYAGWDIGAGNSVSQADDFRTVTLENGEAFQQEFSAVMEPNKEYNLIFYGYVESGGPMTMKVSCGAHDAINPDDLTQISDLYIEIPVDTEANVHTLRLKTPTGQFSGVGFTLKFEVGASTSVKWERVVLNEGRVGLLHARPTHQFLQNLRYNETSGLWEVTNDGVNWEPLLTTESTFAVGILSGSIGVQQGIQVAYNAGTSKIDYNVDDFELTFGGDVAVVGPSTVINLADTHIDLSVRDYSHDHAAQNMEGVINEDTGLPLAIQVPIGGSFDEYIIAVVEDAGIVGPSTPVDLNVAYDKFVVNDPAGASIATFNFEWVPGSLAVYIDGVRQAPDTYVEQLPHSKAVTFSELLPYGTVILGYSLFDSPTAQATLDYETDVDYGNLDHANGLYTIPFTWTTGQLAVYVNGVRQTYSDFSESGAQDIQFQPGAFPNDGDRLYVVATEDTAGVGVPQLFITDGFGDVMPAP
jgi:hypothetical protein